MELSKSFMASKNQRTSEGAKARARHAIDDDAAAATVFLTAISTSPQSSRRELFAYYCARGGECGDEILGLGGGDRFCNRGDARSIQSRLAVQDEEERFRRRIFYFPQRMFRPWRGHIHHENGHKTDRSAYARARARGYFLCPKQQTAVTL